MKMSTDILAAMQEEFGVNFAPYVKEDAEMAKLLLCAWFAHKFATYQMRVWSNKDNEYVQVTQGLRCGVLTSYITNGTFDSVSFKQWAGVQLGHFVATQLAIGAYTSYGVATLIGKTNSLRLGPAINDYVEAGVMAKKHYADGDKVLSICMDIANGNPHVEAGREVVKAMKSHDWSSLLRDPIVNVMYSTMQLRAAKAEDKITEILASHEGATIEGVLSLASHYMGIAKTHGGNYAATEIVKDLSTLAYQMALVEKGEAPCIKQPQPNLEVFAQIAVEPVLMHNICMKLGCFDLAFGESIKADGQKGKAWRTLFYTAARLQNMVAAMYNNGIGFTLGKCLVNGEELRSPFAFASKEVKWEVIRLLAVDFTERYGKTPQGAFREDYPQGFAPGATGFLHLPLVKKILLAMGLDKEAAEAVRASLNDKW